MARNQVTYSAWEIVLATLKRGEYTPEQVAALMKAGNAASVELTKKSEPVYKATGQTDAELEELLTNLIVDYAGDDIMAEVLRSELMARAPGKPGVDSFAPEDIDRIESAVHEASMCREDFERADGSDDPEANEYETSYEEAWDEAHRLLKDFMKKHPLVKMAKKPSHKMRTQSSTKVGVKPQPKKR